MNGVKIVLAPYKVRKYTSWIESRAFKAEDANDLLIVLARGKLPQWGNMVVLHASHANGSSPMDWDSASSTYKCPNCEKKIPLSKNLYSLLLAEISAETYASVREQEVGIHIAHSTTIFPIWANEGQIFAIRQ